MNPLSFLLLLASAVISFVDAAGDPIPRVNTLALSIGLVAFAFAIDRIEGRIR